MLSFINQSDILILRLWRYQFVRNQGGGRIGEQVNCDRCLTVGLGEGGNTPPATYHLVAVCQHTGQSSASGLNWSMTNHLSVKRVPWTHGRHISFFTGRKRGDRSILGFVATHVSPASMGGIVNICGPKGLTYGYRQAQWVI